MLVGCLREGFCTCGAGEDRLTPTWGAQVVDKYGGLDSRTEWSTMLSLGEQQRLAFARLLLARPSLALLDESTRYCIYCTASDTLRLPRRIGGREWGCLGSDSR